MGAVLNQLRVLGAASSTTIGDTREPYFAGKSPAHYDSANQEWVMSHRISELLAKILNVDHGAGHK
jgi:hypothetical protein